AARIVLGVDPDRMVDSPKDVDDDLFDLPWQAAAVRVAPDEAFGAPALGCLEAGQCVGRICPETIEEMLGVVEDPSLLAHEEGDALLDHSEVRVEAGTQDFRDVERPGLPEDGAYRRAGVDQGLEVPVFLREGASASRRAEGGDRCVLPGEVPSSLEELCVLGIGAGPTAFDEGDTELIQTLGDTQFVLGGEADPLALAAVTKGGVVDVDASHAFLSILMSAA